MNTEKPAGNLAGHHHPPIPIPGGKFRTNEDEARWLEQILTMRIDEVLRAAGVNATVAPKGLYELMLLSLESADRRARRNIRS